jgi:uncharacterized protein
MIFKRFLAKNISNYLESDSEFSNTLLLSGARQVGKSFLIKEILKSYPHVFVNLFENQELAENIDRTKNFKNLEKLFLAELNFKPSQGKVLVFDEAQESKNLGRWIRFFKENWPHQKVVLLGSILSNLFENQSNYPVGRVIEYSLRPMTFAEFLNARELEGQCEIISTLDFENLEGASYLDALQDSYLEYLQCGGMPESIANAKSNQELFDYWTQRTRQYAIDVERHLDDNYKSLFLALIKRVAELTCQPVKYSSLHSTQTKAYRQIPKLLEILDKWFVILKCPLTMKNPETTKKMGSKRYLFDVGLTSSLLNQSYSLPWKNRSDFENVFYGKLQENFIHQELTAFFQTPDTPIEFYKEKTRSKEIDFLVKGKLPIEVKSRHSINRNELKPMLDFLNNFNLKTGIYVFNGNPQCLMIDGKKIYAINAFMVTSLLNQLL